MAINDKLLGGATGDAPSSLDPRDHFGTVLYTGTGSTQSINGGKYDACASFNGSNSIINFGAGGIQATSAVSNSFSISWWMKTTATDKNALFNTYGSGSGAFGFSLEMGYDVSTAGKLKLWTNYGSTVTTGFSTDAINDGNWKHIVIVKDVSGATMKVYVNNSEVLSASIGTSAHVGNPLVFGSYTDHAAYEYTGLFDQARVYDSALSSSEVTSLYNESYANSFKVNFPTGKTATALYRLNGNANDETGAYDATATNVTWKYGVNFKPDLCWIKERSGTERNVLIDSTRGVNRQATSDSTAAETTHTNDFDSFDTGGFTLGSATETNGNTKTFVAWCWKANGGTTSSNSNGSITTTVQANDEAGFSIINYDMNITSSTAFTIGHGLSSAPELVFFFSLDQSGSTSNMVYPNNHLKDLVLDANGAFAGSTSAYWNSTAPSNTVINMGTPWGQYHAFYGGDTIAYAFHSVDGYSKISSYTGNGNDHGPMVETGFEIAFVLIKRTDASGESWIIFDNARNASNPRNCQLRADESAAESCGSDKVNFYSDGFQPLTNWDGYNASGGTYLYFAIAAPPETTTPVVADSFNISTWTGNDSSVNPRNVEMTFGGEKPGLVWIKARDNGNNNHQLYDIVRGAGSSKNLQSNENYYEGQYASTYGYLSNINTDGFELTTGSSNANFVNENGATYVGWGWKASGSSEILTGSGSNNDVVASVNDEAGFSIVTYEGTGSSGMKIRHGLSATPAMVMVKKLDANPAAWMVWFDQGLTDFDYYLNLNTDSAEVDSVGTGFSAAPDANLLTFGTSGIGNDANLRYVAYCWRRIDGYSGFGTYSGNSTAGRLIPINDGDAGFQPDWVMVRAVNATSNWFVLDSVRGGTKDLRPNGANAEEIRAAGITFASTGFELDDTSVGFNATGTNYVYAAFKIN